EAKAGADLVQTNEYDGLNRRIVKTTYVGNSPSFDRHYYYDNQWQVVEERLYDHGGMVEYVSAQYVWHPQYVDALALRYVNTDAIDGPETHHYYLQDANYNVTAVTDDAGAVVERYAYSPYGEATRAIVRTCVLEALNKSGVSC